MDCVDGSGHRFWIGAVRQQQELLSLGGEEPQARRRGRRTEEVATANKQGLLGSSGNLLKSRKRQRKQQAKGDSISHQLISGEHKLMHLRHGSVVHRD